MKEEFRQIWPFCEDNRNSIFFSVHQIILTLQRGFLLPKDSAERWFCFFFFFFALQSQQTLVNCVISCCASALMKPSSSFHLIRMLYLSRHVYDISENTNFLCHSSDGKSSMLRSPKACSGVECCSCFTIVYCDGMYRTGLCFFVTLFPVMF